jgi:hypothetical protein
MDAPRRTVATGRSCPFAFMLSKPRDWVERVQQGFRIA